MRRRCRFLSDPTFFGLTPKAMEGIYEGFFILKHFGGWSLTEIHSLPIGLRTWFIERLKKQFEDEAKEMKKAQKR